MTQIVRTEGLVKRYDGTRLGRQELDDEIVPRAVVGCKHGSQRI